MTGRELIIGYGSALDFWRAARIAGAGPATEPEGVVFGACRDEGLQARAKRAADLCGSGLPLDTVVGARGERRNCDAMNDRVWSGPLAGQLTRLDNEAWVCSFAATFVQLGSLLDEVELAALAYEMCGTYGLPSTAIDEGAQDLAPLTAVAELRSYASAAHALGVRGAKRACDALGLVVDGSNSPRETDLAVLLSLSRRKGGYDLRGFEMNAVIKVPKSQKAALGQASITPDFLWLDKKVALEYDSNAHHLSPQEKEHDEARRRVLENMGFRVFVMTNEVIRSDVKLGTFMLDLQGALGVRRTSPTVAILRAQEGMRYRAVRGFAPSAT